MSKPLGYYTDNTKPEIANLEEKYGSHLQEMPEEEKITLVTDIAGQLNSGESSSQLTQTDKVGLLKALVNSL